MEALKRFFASRIFTTILLIIGSIVILDYYLEKIPQVYIVWELMDEFGYLADAAYLSGNKWPYVTDFYYGYGYSLWLIPLFLIYDTGIEIIRGALAVNAVIVVLLFLVQYVLMSKVCKKLNRNIVVLCSFVVSFYPYIVASGMKIVCETALTLVLWTCGLLLYQALETNKWYYYALLAACTVYMFFVHSRTFVFAGVMAVVIVLLVLMKKINFKQLVLMIGVAGVLLFVGFTLKAQVIENVYTKSNIELVEDIAKVSVEKTIGTYRSTSALTESTESADNKVEESTEKDTEENAEKNTEVETEKKTSVKNVFTVSYVIKRILNVFSNFSVWYIYGFFCRNFYLFVGTLGLFHIGVFAAFKDAFAEWRETKNVGAANAIKFLFAVAAIMALLAIVVHSPYSFKLPAYNFYGRYYEYAVAPMVFLGLDYCMRKRMRFGAAVTWLGLLVVSYWFTMDLGNYLEVQDLRFDSFRLAALSNFTEAQEFQKVVEMGFVTVIVLALLLLLMNYYKETRILIALLLMALFMNNNEVIEAEILELQRENYEDLDLVTFIQNYYDVDEVYFLNSGFRYPDAYAGLQPLLHKDDLIVLDGEESDKIQSGELFITFHNNPYIEQMEQSLDFICETTYYELYLVE